MVDISKQIQIYIGRNVDFSTEVILRANENGVYIDQWNITDKPQPTIDQLINLVDIQGLIKQKLVENRLNFNTRLNSGVTLNNIKYDCDNIAISRITGQIAAIMAFGITDNITWYDYNSQPQILTIDQFKQLGQLILTTVSAIEAKNSQVISYLNVGNITAEQINAIDINYSSI